MPCRSVLQNYFFPFIYIIAYWDEKVKFRVSS
uniref:Uncharacterized protein n=1 Tax=Siphoviridae sp. ct2vX3 TaxID=2825318 RepID=A0A8S5PYP2_9CAUD|nr:MAG TPA: hypothetical protein [Siphoviridae sp. ct2vX3]